VVRQNIQSREKVDALIQQGRYAEALKLNPSDTIALMRFIEQLVDAAKYADALQHVDALKNANQSGVGFSTYPKIALAYERDQ